MENFFSRMKCELNITKRSRMQEFSAYEIENKVRRYIDWYNKRIQKKLRYMSPVEFRNLRLKELEDAKLVIWLKRWSRCVYLSRVSSWHFSELSALFSNRTYFRLLS